MEAKASLWDCQFTSPWQLLRKKHQEHLGAFDFSEPQSAAMAVAILNFRLDSVGFGVALTVFTALVGDSLSRSRLVLLAITDQGTDSLGKRFLHFNALKLVLATL